MTESGEIQAAFDRRAGAAFSFAGTMSAVLSDSLVFQEQLLLWLLASHSLVAGGSGDGAADWLEEHLGYLAERSEGLAAALRQRLQRNWAAWLPLLLLSDSGKVAETWSAFCAAVPPESAEESAVRDVLLALVRDHGSNLFSPQGISEEYASSPAQAVVFRVGGIVKKLQVEGAREWARACADILRRLPDRVTRGFLPHSPLFQDMLLSLLDVAEWLLEPRAEQTIDFIKDCWRRPDEALTVNQIALSSALYGWLVGYSNVGGLIADRRWRIVLAEQAMATALAGRCVAQDVCTPSDPVSFYATEDGTRKAFRHFLRPIEISREEKRHERIFWSEETHKWGSDVRVHGSIESVVYRLSPSLTVSFTEPRANCAETREY